MDISKMLSPEQIKERIEKFNETNDWSVFDDVPPEQHYAVMYPYSIKRLTFNTDLTQQFKELKEARNNGKTIRD